VQIDLHEQTMMQEQPVGAVLETPGYGDYECIYHIGHQPAGIRTAGALSTSEEAGHFRVIRDAVGNVLHRFSIGEAESIGFPLIGCGSFRLDPWLLAYEFVDELLQHVENQEMYDREVWIVVGRDEDYPNVLNAIIQALSDRQQPGMEWTPIQLGVDYIDRFEERASMSRHPLWATWTVTRYAELLTGYLFYELCRVWPEPIAPRDVSEEVRCSFGFIYNELTGLASKITSEQNGLPGWAHTVAEVVFGDRKKKRIKGIIEDRNHIAHGRQARSVHSIRDDLHAFVEEAQLHDCVDRMIPEPDLSPWTRLFSGNVGVLDRWQSNKWTYVVPYLRRSHTVSPT
jgi:O-acetyl-ADP-ribose deacetylase (regulator of RNase III)